MSKKVVKQLKIVVLLKLVVLAAFIFADIFSGLCAIGLILLVKWLTREDHLPWVANSAGIALVAFAECMVMYTPTAALGFPAALVGTVALTFVFGLPIDLLVMDANDDDIGLSGPANSTQTKTTEIQVVDAQVIDD